MRCRNSKLKQWTTKGRVEAIKEAHATKAARLRELAARSSRQEPTGTETFYNGDVGAEQRQIILSRGRYHRTLSGAETTAGACKPIFQALALSKKDQRDRNILVWPNRPDNGFVAAALFLLERRIDGERSPEAIGLWPWRNGIQHTSKSILVEIDELVRYARLAAQERIGGAFWTKQALSDDSHEMLCLRLNDLRQSKQSTKDSVTVRLPSLFELTSIFEPNPGLYTYQANSDHILYRVRRYTQINDKRGLSTRNIKILGDPLTAPMAVFGLPWNDDRTLRKCLEFKTPGRERLDVILVDLTRTTLSFLGDRWTDALSSFLATLETLAGPRPGVVVLTEDVFIYRKAEKLLQEAAQRARPRRPAPEAVGVMLSSAGFLGNAPTDTTFPAIEVHADLKDTRLLALRNQVLGVARSLEENEDEKTASVLRAGLSFVRSTANLPIGLDEARHIVETIYSTEDDADRAARLRFYPATALSQFTDHALISSHSAELLSFRNKFMAMTEEWRRATPVSLKLKSIAEKLGRSAARTMLVLPDRHVVDLYNLSNEVQGTFWRVAKPQAMLETAATQECDHWIVVRPSSETLRLILTASPGPRRLDLVGDAAGSALLECELRPLIGLEAFLPVRTRARAMLKALENLGSTLSLDYEEMHARAQHRQSEIDFTRAGGAYSGPQIRIETERDFLLRYRPASEVLQHTADDLRPFQKVEAQSIRAGDTILVLTPSLMELLRRELARAPKTVETLRQYHSEIGRRREALAGASLRDKARSLVASIQSKHPEFENAEYVNVARWLDVDGSTLDDPSAQPQAPRSIERYRWFLTALNVPAPLTDVWWEHGIRLTRSYRQSEGLQFNQRAVSFVLDPESFLARAEFKDVSFLQHAIMESTDTVLRVEQVNARSNS